MCHDVSRSAPAVAGSVASSDGPREGTATTDTAHRSSPLPVQGVKRRAQQREYKCCCPAGATSFPPLPERSGFSEGFW